jgi:hypothetical protein
MKNPNLYDSYFYLIDYIKHTPDWFNKLQAAPYFIEIIKDKDHNYFMFNYNPRKSPFDNNIVRCCRGSVLEINQIETNSIAISGAICEFPIIEVKPICLPFYKFGNYDEGYCEKIDWASAKKQEKIDGHFIKIVRYNNEILYFSNKCFCVQEPLKSILNSLLNTQQNQNWLNSLPANYTFMFELVSPSYPVVVKYPKDKLYFLGVRDNISFKEISVQKALIYFNIPFEPTTLFGLENYKAQDIKNFMKDWKEDKEGIVVCDKDFNRVKIKSETYRNLKFAFKEGYSEKSIFEMIKTNSFDDAIVEEKPELKNTIENLKKKFNLIEEKINEAYQVGVRLFNTSFQSEVFYLSKKEIMERLDKSFFIYKPFVIAGLKEKKDFCKTFMKNLNYTKFKDFSNFIDFDFDKAIDRMVIIND